MKNIPPFGHGAIPSKKDKRDIKDTSLSLASPYPQTYSTDISPLNFTERYQKKIGVCVACAITTYVEWLYYKKTGTYTKLSVAFLYIVIKKLIDKNLIEGTSLRAGINAAMKYGICKESTFSTNYDLTNEQMLALAIPQNAFTEALDYTIGGYFSVPIEQSLMAGTMFKYGLILSRFSVSDKWYSPSWLPKDIFPLLGGKEVSGHALDHFSYDLITKPRFDFMNWWSINWGNHGTGYSNVDDYAPTECWVLTLESQAHTLIDNTPLIQDSVWRKLMVFLRSIGNLN